MAHAQQQILDALHSVLAAGGTVAAGRVFVDPIDPLQPAQLPAIVLEESSSGESAEPFTISSLERRELTVQVHCIISHKSSAAADTRAFGLAVEKLLAASPTLAALASQGWHMTSSRPVLNGDAEILFASRLQTWVFAYLVRPEAPDILL